MFSKLPALSLSCKQMDIIDQESDARYEDLKTNVLRIILGLIVLYRWIYIADVTFMNADYVFWPVDLDIKVHRVWRVVIMLSLISLFTIGFFTPLVTLTLAIGYYFQALALGCYNLGDAILIVTLLTMVYNGVGQQLSVDAWLLKRFPRASGFLKFPYRLFGSPCLDKRRTYYFIAFVMYGLISLGAVLFHLQDPYWLRGQTSILLFVNPYLNPYFEFFRWLDQTFPVSVEVFSRFAAVVQTFFQIYMIPLVLIGFWTRSFVVLYGFMFFIISALFLNVSYLPYIEVVLWTLIFVPGRWFARLLDPLSKTYQPLVTTGPVRGVFSLIICYYLVTGAIFIGTRVPYVNQMVGIGRLPALDFYMFPAGYHLPNVFNETDLSTATTWFLAYRVKEDGTRELVPIHDKNGARLDYFKADVLYFGVLTKWRRKFALASEKEIENSHRPGGWGHNMLKIVLDIDSKYQGEPTMYEIEIIRNRGLELDLPPEERYATKSLLTFQYEANPPSLRG